MADAPIDMPLTLYGGVDKILPFRIEGETLDAANYRAQVRRTRTGKTTPGAPLISAEIATDGSGGLTITFEGEDIRTLPADCVWDLKELPLDGGVVWASGDVTVTQGVSR